MLTRVDCQLCLQSDPAFHTQLWRTFGAQRNAEDAMDFVRTQHPGLPVNEAMLRAHFARHYPMQPPPAQQLRWDQDLALADQHNSKSRKLLALVARLRTVSQAQAVQLIWGPAAANLNTARAAGYRDMRLLAHSDLLYRARVPDRHSFASRPGLLPARHVMLFPGAHLVPWAAREEPGALYVVTAPHQIDWVGARGVHASVELLVGLQAGLGDGVVRQGNRQLLVSLALDSTWGAHWLRLSGRLPTSGRSIEAAFDLLATIKLESFGAGARGGRLVPLALLVDPGWGPLQQLADRIGMMRIASALGLIGQRFPDLHTPPPLVVVASSPTRLAQLRSLLADAPAPLARVDVWMTDAVSWHHAGPHAAILQPLASSESQGNLSILQLALRYTVEAASTALTANSSLRIDLDAGSIIGELPLSTSQPVGSN